MWLDKSSELREDGQELLHEGAIVTEALETQASRLLQIAEELEKALAHAKVASSHFKSNEVPRACAHALALEGHIAVAQEVLKQVAKDHRLRARAE